jgi:hypothetical protein
MVRQELNKTLGSVQRTLRQADAEVPATATQRVIRAMIRGFGVIGVGPDADRRA